MDLFGFVEPESVGVAATHPHRFTERFAGFGDARWWCDLSLEDCDIRAIVGLRGRW